MSRPKKKGFTLVELVVVLVIMTVILGIAIPSVFALYENGRIPKK